MRTDGAVVVENSVFQEPLFRKNLKLGYFFSYLCSQAPARDLPFFLDVEEISVTKSAFKKMLTQLERGQLIRCTRSDDEKIFVTILKYLAPEN